MTANPFRAQTRIAVSLNDAESVTVSVYDALGRRVAVLHDGPLTAGTHTFAFDGAMLPSGAYVIRAGGDTFVESRRMALSR